MKDNIFTRTEDLIGQQALQSLQKCRVAVFGLGGVGSFVAEALTRSGIGFLCLIDKDIVKSSNINRQLIALQSTVGRPKVDVMTERIADINPDAVVEKRHEFYRPETSEQFNLAGFDYVIDAVDTVIGKIELAVQCHKSGTPLISSMGAGNKLDPTKFIISDIFATKFCPLCRVMRKELKRRGIKKVKVVYSPEPPVIKKRTPGSIAFVPSVAGLIIAGEVVRDLIGFPLEPVQNEFQTDPVI